MTVYIDFSFCVRRRLLLYIPNLLERELLSCNPSEELITACRDDDSAVIIRNMFGSDQRVPDVDRYRIVRQNRELKILNPDRTEVCGDGLCNDQPEEGFPSGNTIAIILESPHRSEFHDGLVPHGPAMGTTGRRIFRGLVDAINRSPDVLERLMDENRVVITNPVPFQASLFAIHKNRLVPKYRRDELRDATWKCIWSVCEVRRKFMERLMSYQPHTVLNLCTGKDEPGTLSRRITEELLTDFSEQLFVGQHPAWPKWATKAKFERPVHEQGNRT